MASPPPIPEPAEDAGAVEVSVVIPCLNEADTLGRCIEKAWAALREHGLRGEIVVADNASDDESPAIASRLGARLIRVEARGYGSTLRGGIAAARGRYIVMGDADESYDFGEVPRFVAKLKEGYDLVQGCRLESGGGRVMPGAMPFLHHRIGNPLFSVMASSWFAAPIHDVFCGMRGFTRELHERIDERCTGMEFAVEMVIKASIAGARMAELPITLYADGRKAHATHLRTFRDGWRTLHIFLLYSPRRLFFIPGLTFAVLGLLGYAIALPSLRLKGVTFDAHTLLVASLAIISGYQSMIFATLTQVFLVTEGLLPPDPRSGTSPQGHDFQSWLVVGGVGMLAGVALILAAVGQWWSRDFGPLDYSHTMKWVVPGVTLTTLGLQTILSSFFGSILTTRRR